MAADQANPEAGKMDYPAHERNYSGFIKLLKMVDGDHGDRHGGRHLHHRQLIARRG